MTTTTVGRGKGDRGRAGPPGGAPTARALLGPWARRLLAWLTETGYRSERHYLRGGRGGGAMPPRLRPA